MLISKLKKHEEYVLDDDFTEPIIVEYLGKNRYKLPDGKSVFEHMFRDYGGIIYTMTLRQVHQVIHCEEEYHGRIRESY